MELQGGKVWAVGFRVIDGFKSSYNYCVSRRIDDAASFVCSHLRRCFLIFPLPSVVVHIYNYCVLG